MSLFHSFRSAACSLTATTAIPLLLGTALIAGCGSPAAHTFGGGNSLPDGASGSAGVTTGTTAGGNGTGSTSATTGGTTSATNATGATNGAGTAGTSSAGSDGGTKDSSVDVSVTTTTGGSTAGTATGGADGGAGDAGGPMEAGARCGNGMLDPGEQCDDGNTIVGDGCDNDCSYSCRKDGDCAVTDPCKGTSSCDTSKATGHACTKPIPLDDGMTCDLGGGPGICRGGLCASAKCGDGTLDTAEECDDGNGVNGDGCEANCHFTCVSTDPTRSCKTANPCATVTCDNSTHKCGAEIAVRDNTSCGANSYCVAGVCKQGRCGNSMLEVNEECDDGNTVDGDGCNNTCLFSCHGAPDCTPNDTCKGTSTCAADHKCTTPSPLMDGAICSSCAAPPCSCKGGLCKNAACGDGIVQMGEECDDGNGLNGDGCEVNCKYSCHGDANCTPINPCLVSTCGANHACTQPTPIADSPATTCGAHNYCKAGQCIAAICGNGVAEPTEICDDGHTTACGNCNADCTGAGTGGLVCGDGIVCADAGETCDDGFADACGSCNATCKAAGDGREHAYCGCASNPPTETVTSCGLGICFNGVCSTPPCTRFAGCGGSVAPSGAAALCAPGCRLAHVSDFWFSGVAKPVNDYYLGDTLYYNGANANCTVSTAKGAGFSQCGGLVATTGRISSTGTISPTTAAASDDPPVLEATGGNFAICGSTAADKYGNTCNWAGCSYSDSPPSGTSTNGAYGGCAATAGALCVCPCPAGVAGCP